MKTIKFFLKKGLLILFPISLFASNPSLKSKNDFKIPDNISAKDYQANELIIKLKSNIDFNNLPISFTSALESIGNISIKQIFPHTQKPMMAKNSLGYLIDLTKIYRLTLNGKISLEQSANTLLNTGVLEYVDLHYFYKMSDKYTPNDPDTTGTKNYYLKITKAYEAWTVSKGDTNVVIGIVDSGSDTDHPDLKSNIKINYSDPINGLDDDNDGYVDNYIGWDLGGADYQDVVGDNDPNIKGNNNFHGSHVSGCASAVSDNNIGVPGMGFNSKLLIVKCAADNDTRSNGDGLIIAGYEGIQYAADHGAKIINCSWGGAGGGSFGQDVIDYATINKGCLVVAAAGNDNTQNDSYPAAYNYIFNVAASTAGDKKANFSNFGYTVDITTPGNQIYSTLYNNSYNYLSGTSMASPLTAGAAALVAAVFPNYNGLQIGEQLRVNADNIDGGNAIYKLKLGGGRLNVYRALTQLKPSVRSINRIITDKYEGGLLPGDTISIFSDFINYLNPTSNCVVTLSILGSNASNFDILNNEIVLGAVNTLETKKDLSPFRVAINDIPENLVVNFKLTYVDDNYSDFQVFSVIMNKTSLNILVNKVSSTATSIGRLGYNDGGATEGLGFKYKGNSMMYEAAYIIGYSATKISNNARAASGTVDNDFKSVSRTSKINGVAEFESKGIFNDANNSTPLNIQVNHREFAFADTPLDKFIILEYKLINKSGADLSNFFAGYFADFDIGTNSADIAKNKAKYDATRRLGYSYNTLDKGLYAGIKMLTKNAPATFHGMSNQATYGNINLNDGFNDAEKFESISTANGPEAGDGAGKPEGEDVLMSVGSGPFEFKNNDTIIVAYAFIAGDSLSDLTKSADDAQIKYDEIIPTFVKENSSNSNISIFPNPSVDISNLLISSDEKGIVQLEIIDMMGKRMMKNNIEKTNGKELIIPINLKNFISGSYLVKVTLNSKVEHSIVIKK